MLMTGFANSFAAAAVWRALTGIGSGASNVPVIGLLAAWFVQRRRGMATGIGVTGSSLALIVLGLLVPHVGLPARTDRTVGAFAGLFSQA